MPILHYISANSDTCGATARTFVEPMNSLEVTLNRRYNLRFLRFSLPQIGDVQNFGPNL